MVALLDLVGHRYGRLLVIEQAESRRGNTQWLCQCDCGTMVTVDVSNLRRKRRPNVSCGCYGREDSARRRTKHGARVDPERNALYNIWRGIKKRCYNADYAPYPDYGGRGITLTPEWVDDFEAFEAYIGPRPGTEYSIDRIDNDGNYEPGNVRWATRVQQANNRRPARPPVFEEICGAATIRGRLCTNRVRANTGPCHLHR